MEWRLEAKVKRGGWRCKDVGCNIDETCTWIPCADAVRERLREDNLQILQDSGGGCWCQILRWGTQGRRKKDKREASQVIEFKRSMNPALHFTVTGTQAQKKGAIPSETLLLEVWSRDQQHRC